MKFLKIRRGRSLRTRNRKVKELLEFYQSQHEINSVECNYNELRNNENLIQIKVKESELEQYESDNDIINLPSSHILQNPQESMFTADSDYKDISEELSLKEDLRLWSLETKVSNSTVDSLLNILRKYGHQELPKTSRTLKGTPKSITTRKIGSGRFWYSGVASFIDVLKEENISLPETLTLNTNMDGVNLFNSSKAVFWPILGKFIELDNLKPFVIALYFDENGSKPNDVNDYLHEYVEEILELLSSNYKGIQLKLGQLPLDAPALAFVKDTKGHNAKKACHKCRVVGKSISKRMCFTQVENLIPRTDEQFRSHSDPEHHRSAMNGKIEKLPLNMTDNFSLDYLHIVLLGVTRKTLNILVSIKKNQRCKFPLHPLLRIKLRKTNFEEVNQITMKARNTQPLEITRSIRTLDFLSVMKGKELRTFIVYYGIVALRNNVHKDIYDNYQKLHIGLTICLSNQHRHLLAVAKMAFRDFVKDYKILYGNYLCSYNVHNLLHLVDEVQRLGPLDNYSTFPFENLLGFLKTLPHSGHLPLEQAVNRYSESIHMNIYNYKMETEAQCMNFLI